MGGLIPEVEHTPASDFCPRPEFWHSEDMSATEREVSEFLGGLVRLIQPEICVETGTYLGHTAYQIGKALSLNGHGTLYSVELDWEFCQKARARCLCLPVEVIEGRAGEWIPPGKIDFLFLDSSDDRYKEFLHYKPYMAVGAIVALHDVKPGGHGNHPGYSILADSCQGIVFHNPRGLLVCKIKEIKYGV